MPRGKVVFKKGTGEDDRPRSGLWLESRFGNGVVLNQFLSRDVAAMKITAWVENVKKEIVVCSAYFDITRNEIPEQLVLLVEYCTENKLDLLVGCDANAHNTVWGCENNNSRGDMVLDFILLHKLCILNKGNEPTFFRTGDRRIVDLTLATSSL